ncbi:acyltransferase [Spiribacter aquaticus]|uniref:Acyltransferase n=1 Tax=Spiribacter aquaticus TaxID=1935996 RepID=A0A557RNK3_9GAMM|nr:MULTISPECIES: acyltransferase [Spiribacter]TVO66708.1 acyltransferase [Spiribacter aquaticus]
MNNRRIKLPRFLVKEIIKRVLTRVKYIGLKNTLTYFFFQRILRINSHVEWPVHWASIVSSPDRIQRGSFRPYPGYMPGQYIQAVNGVVIGRNVRLGPGVKIISADHDVNDFQVHLVNSPIYIGDNCWLGADSVILPGVKLGNHVVVAAGAVVTKSFGENVLVGGIPARVIKRIGAYQGKVDYI